MPAPADESTIEVQRRGFRARGTTFMVFGGLVGALGAYLFQLIGGRSLGTEGFAPVSILWTTFFILVSVLLVPVEQYVTREVASGRKALPTDFRPAGVMAAIGVAIGSAFVALTLDDLFEGDWQYVAQIALLVIGYALLMVGKGVLAGSRRFAGVGWVLIVEAVARLAAGVLAIVVIGSAVSLGWAMVIGGFSVLALGWWRHDRGDQAEPSSARRFLTGYVAGTSSSQVLLAGAPLAVYALGGSSELISVAFFTFTIFRAPLTLIFSLQGRILPFLVSLAGAERKADLARIARVIVLIVAPLAALGGLVGWLIGPDVMSLLLGEEFMPTAGMAAFAASGITAAAGAQVISQVLVAEGRTKRLAWAWFGGLATAIVVMVVLANTVDLRVAVGFAAGEWTALVAMAVLAIRR